MSEAISFHDFQLQGGPCAGEMVRLPVETIHGAWRPQDAVLQVRDGNTITIYHRHAVQSGPRRWYEFHPYPQII
jgi:hypothetical protein